MSRRVELLATVVMAAAAILTAWAAFQSAKWNGVQSIEYSRATAARIESVSSSNTADSLRSIDLAVFLTWLEAVGAEIRDGTTVVEAAGGYQPVDGSRSAFYYHRMRDEFLPALEAWIATEPLTDPDAPKSPFAMEQYRIAEEDAAMALQDRAEDHTTAATTAARNSDNHVLTAVLLALAIFFAGIATKLESDTNRLYLVVVSDSVFIGAVVVLIWLPKVPIW